MPHGDTTDTRGRGWATRVCHQSRITKTCSREVGIIRLPSAQHLVVITVPLSPRQRTKKPKAKPTPDTWALPCTYMGGKESLPPAGSLGPSGVPTLLGYFELMAGSLTCARKHTEPWLRDRSSDAEGGQSQTRDKTHGTG